MMDLTACPPELWEELNALMCKVRADFPDAYRWVQSQADPFAALARLNEVFDR